jgi:hypothetical protein
MRLLRRRRTDSTIATVQLCSAVQSLSRRGYARPLRRSSLSVQTDACVCSRPRYPETYAAALRLALSRASVATHPTAAAAAAASAATVTTVTMRTGLRKINELRSGAPEAHHSLPIM